MRGVIIALLTLFMWQHKYKTSYYIEDDFAVIMAEDEGDVFSILPLATKEKLPKVLDLIVNHFEKDNKKIYFRGINKEVCDILKE